MVRIEFQMERLKFEVEQCVNRVENIKTEVSDQMKANQQELENGFETSMKEVVSNVTSAVKAKLLELQDTVTPTVAFKARLKSRTAVVGGQTIVFPVLIFKEGDAYNSGTGKFTAPISGVYMFSLAFCVYSKKSLTVSIMVEGTRYSTSLFDGDDGHGCSSADTVAIVTAGQEVWVEVISGGTSTGTITDHSDSYRWNTFSGALINRRI
ncbi:complement C1q and tumor necrosis factor-related protein 9-like [Ruditapes philippinarum]|uniref:complement C1q and tumor necrosis factor-related protein 9-like n=1 Tax=Ruditapes philippinarum TaxID=129788 RepID=UPI00295B9C49|nr:complement C1q and tumor necrosis factor-related protein 9-like [Ruditapes philippinarum]